MKYAYLVFMKPWGLKGPTQEKTLLGVHCSRRSADDHFDGVLADRMRHKDYVSLTSHPGELGYPDWCYRRLRFTVIQNEHPELGKACPDWYAVSEEISMEQWRVSRPKKGKRKCRR